MTIKEALEKRAKLGKEIQRMADEVFNGKDPAPTDEDHARWKKVNEDFDAADAAVKAARAKEVITRDGVTTPMHTSNPSLPSGVRGQAGIDAGGVADEYTDTRGNLVPALARGQSLRARLVQGGLDPAEDQRDFNLRSMLGATGASGGFFLPLSMSAAVIDNARNLARVFQAGARTVPMTTREMTIAKVTGDPTAAWVGELKAITASDVAVGAVVLRARTLAALVKVSVELWEDAPNLDSIIANSLGESLALELDRAALFGDGTDNEPLGVFNQPAVQSQAVSGSNVLTIDDLSRMYQKVQEANGVPNAWILNPATNGYLNRLTDGEARWMELPPDVRPLLRLVTNQIGTTHNDDGDESPIFMGDFTTLLVGVRTRLQLEASRVGSDSNSSAMTNKEVWVRAYMRADVVAERENWLCKLTGNVSANLT